MYDKETNMQLYNRVRVVPKEAQREITAGRLKGKTDINPMWRIQTLTEQFGPAGIGWWTETLERWVDRNELTGEATANIRILLFAGSNHPVEGIGGAMLIANEKSGQFTDDEAWKKAYTDAISVACKALGMGANIYWKEGATKYTARPTTHGAAQAAQNAQRQPEAGKDTPKAQTAEKTQPASQIERPNVMDDNYYRRILAELIEGTGVTLEQIDKICLRDMGKTIENLNEHERKKFYVDTKTGIMKIKGGKA